MLRERIKLVGGVEIADDVQKKVKSVGVRGLDFEKAKELGVFMRIGNLLTAAHATILAAYKIYGHADHLMCELNGRKNIIAQEMGKFDKAYEHFINFWTDYYAKGSNAREVNVETDSIYHRVMDWAELPEVWNLGDEQRTRTCTYEDFAIRIQPDDDGRVYTFRSASVDSHITSDEESWGVLCYNRDTDEQTSVHTGMCKADALMVAKRLSAENPRNIYTAAIIRDVTERRTDVTPYKAFVDNDTVGNVMNIDSR